MDRFRGEVATQNAPVADLLETCLQLHRDQWTKEAKGLPSWKLTVKYLFLHGPINNHDDSQQHFPDGPRRHGSGPRSPLPGLRRAPLQPRYDRDFKEGRLVNKDAQWFESPYYSNDLRNLINSGIPSQVYFPLSGHVYKLNRSSLPTLIEKRHR